MNSEMAYSNRWVFHLCSNIICNFTQKDAKAESLLCNATPENINRISVKNICLRLWDGIPPVEKE